ncbi:MAG TPA: hypothetical protein VGO39_12505 [Gaiellaceae bacterium]|jgi:hypothetical protein|nr:hypothetical protein [Gaiellaceae bacterium]
MVEGYMSPEELQRREKLEQAEAETAAAREAKETQERANLAAAAALARLTAARRQPTLVIEVMASRTHGLFSKKTETYVKERIPGWYVSQVYSHHRSAPYSPDEPVYLGYALGEDGRGYRGGYHSERKAFTTGAPDINISTDHDVQAGLDKLGR